MKRSEMISKPEKKKKPRSKGRFDRIYLPDLIEVKTEQKILNLLAGKKCLPDNVDIGYLMGLSHGPLTNALQTHIRSCEKCMARYKLWQERCGEKKALNLDIPGLGEEDNDYMISDEALTLILQSTDDYLKLLEHSGEIVSDLPGRTRGAFGKKSEETVIVKKDLPSYDLSVHVAMSGKFSAAHGEARLFAMKPDLKEYIENLNVSLTGEGSSTQRNTDKLGRVKFPGMKQGKYEIWSGDKLIARITIK